MNREAFEAWFSKEVGFTENNRKEAEICEKSWQAALASQAQQPPLSNIKTSDERFNEWLLHTDKSISAGSYGSTKMKEFRADEIKELRAILQSQAQQPANPKVIALLESAVKEIQRNTCSHEDTHRGGAIWEICDICGCKWADDEGGKPEFVEAKIITDIQSFLLQSQAQQSPKMQFLDRSKEKIITLLWQGICDGTVEAFDVNGMMVIPSEEGMTYVRKEDAISFFGLVEPSQAQQPEYSFDQLTKLMMQAATKEGHKVTMKIKWAQPPAPEGE